LDEHAFPSEFGSYDCEARVKDFSFCFWELWDGDHDGGGKGQKLLSFAIDILSVCCNNNLVVRIGEYLIIWQRIQREVRESPQLINQLGCLGRRVPQTGSVMDRENDVLHLGPP
jgi:hypothetical protein